ncbi:MAG: type II/IV secretion system ATPase subunit, partial [Nitrososphaerota archaeon]
MFKQKAKTEEIRRQWQGIEVFPVKPDFEILDRYVIREKFAEVIVASPPSRVVEPIYYCVEAPLTPQEVNALEKVKDILTKELDFPKIGEEEEVKKVVIDTTKRILNKYRRALGLGTLTDELYEKFIYYIERDMMGFGPLNIIMEDYRVEDVSCDGLGIPIYVWHRDYESMPTNVIFTDREALDDFIIHLAHKAGKHISSAFPIVDAMIYGKHRLAATFREEISPRGSTFTIRKFRERPFSVTELLMANVLNSEMAAYFWLLLEHKASIMILGATGSGKTTLLNALTTFIRPRMKIVTCEETAEINIPRENWVRFVTRESYGLGATERGQVTLFDLVRTSLRYRPDYLIVGEVRGEETFVLFQAIATGHGGISTV